MTNKIPLVHLNDGNSIPQVGLGTWQVRDQTEFNTAFHSALDAGYRHFDTAQIYNNEQFLGKAWQSSGLKREDIFITTKISVQNFGEHKVLSSFEESLLKLKTDYVDLLLLHFPVTILRKKAWLALEQIHKSGKAKSIGVSNYTFRHIQEMDNYANIKPVINQVELHLFLQQPELVKYCKENNIVVEAYSPLARMKEPDNEIIQQIALKHNKTYSQIMLRWLVEQDFVVIPKSITPSRIKENIEIFDFTLGSEDLNKLKQLDKDMRTCWSPVHVP